MEEHQCCKQVYGHMHRMGGDPCTRKGTGEVNGRWYCWQHDPERVERLRKENEEKWDRKYLESKDKGYRRLAEQDVCQGVSTEELEKLGTDGLLYLMDISLRYQNMINNSKGG